MSTLVVIDTATWRLTRYIDRKRFEVVDLNAAADYPAAVVRDVIEAFREKGKDA